MWQTFQRFQTFSHLLPYMECSCGKKSPGTEGNTARWRAHLLHDTELVRGVVEQRVKGVPLCRDTEKGLRRHRCCSNPHPPGGQAASNPSMFSLPRILCIPARTEGRVLTRSKIKEKML